MSRPLYAEVAFPVPLRRVFTYRVSDALQDLIRPGLRCTASFGRRRSVGVVVRLTGEPPVGVKSLKDLDTLLDGAPLYTPDLLELCRWIADYYRCSLGEALFAALPASARRAPRVFLALTERGKADPKAVEAAWVRAGRPRGASAAILARGRVPLTERTRPLVEELRKEGLADLRWEGELVEGRGVGPASIPPPADGGGPEPLPAQQEAVNAVERALREGKYRAFLLHGVTGSGKTEVYLRAIAAVLAQGRQAVALLPEIALTPQTVERFTGRFGDRVAVLHSRLAAGERDRQWRRMARGEASVAVGARSALFAPAPRLGLIVVDEEHDAAYKQEDAPRYHARDAALKRAQLAGAVALLGSATPSLESLYNAWTGKYTLLRLPGRVGGRPLPRVRLVDLREEAARGGRERPILSLPLREALEGTLAAGEQALLFLNRRGYRPVTLCPSCGEGVQCASCAVAFTRHRDPRRGVEFLLCHYCNARAPVPEKCSFCGAPGLEAVGIGTQRLEEEVRRLFPKARVGRLDVDSTRSAGSLEAVLSGFRRRDIDVLIGTQMAAKGHDFPGITLVGVVGADVGLGLPDFRAAERTFQLLVQVAGRAGRGERPGTLYLQTFRPEHPAVRAALRQDVDAFAAEEIETRKVLGYPPFTRTALVLFRSPKEAKARRAAEEAAEALRRRMPAGVDLRGPAPAPFPRLRGAWRFQVFLRSAGVKSLREALSRLEAEEVPSGVVRTVDVDPQNML